MERTPLPSPQFAILMGIRFIEPISFSLLLPFVYFMVRDFHVTDDTDQISFYAGLVASSFAVAECMSGVPWGILSDRIGRKPVLMLGMAGTMVSMLMFGVSQSLAWAIVSRFMAGLLSGNVGVMKSMVTEITDHTNRAIGFSYLSMAFGLGFIVGPAMGGFLIHPADTFPYLFGGSSFLRKFPYFLPCAAAALFCAIGMVLCHIFMEETLGAHDKSVTDPLLGGKLPRNYSGEGLNPQEEPKIGQTTWVAIVSYASLSLMTVMIEELFPFWAATSPEKGGLGFDASRTGSVFAISGLVLVMMQLLVYPFIHCHFGTMFLYKWVFILYIPIILLLPLVGTLDSVFLAVTIAYGCRTCCGVTAFTSYNILLPETCSSRILGKVNGISQSLGSLARAIGPFLCGFVWAWSLGNGLSFPFDYHFMFIVISSMCLVTFCIVTQIKISHSN
ncbi:hypothetical protein DSO57_1000570 [Entomophthora muscae]|uniref:Uncharacterized protein n=1 Tax=Entomophthora muscae TaxID=34485 RepID=A0ACC2SB40_9FUNG|nr:hypothetical protein DSO57_1000570 [Entomophthora muscae]